MKGSCCQAAYDATFDQRSAEKQLKAYLKNGVRKDSRPMMKALEQLPLQDKSLLDIGGGIGVISLELFKKKIRRATHVDISKAYTQTFASEVTRLSLSDKVEIRQGDFQDLADGLDSADLVCLDKVICCYQDYEGLVRSSLQKADRWYAYSVPRSVWWVKVIQQFGEFIKRLSGESFRTFIHPTDAIERLALEAGFRKIYQQHQREWLAVLFEKKE